jgi:hypothetical protein
MTDWQPIETAKKDGTHILAWAPLSGPFEAYWPFPDYQTGDYWRDYWNDRYCRPTYWQPLHPVPEADHGK